MRGQVDCFDGWGSKVILMAAAFLVLAAPALAAKPKLDGKIADMDHKRSIHLETKKGKGAGGVTWSSVVRMQIEASGFEELAQSGPIMDLEGRYVENRKKKTFVLKPSRASIDDLEREIAIALIPISQLGDLEPTNLMRKALPYSVKITKVKIKGSFNKKKTSVKTKTNVEFKARDTTTGKRYAGLYKSRGKGPLRDGGDPSGFEVDLQASPSNGGTILADPDLATYPSGTLVTLSAQPASGFTFTGWSGDISGLENPVELSVDDDLAITANFGTQQNFELEVRLGGIGAGNVTGSGIDCGNDCNASFASGTTVTLSANPIGGSTFSAWQGCDSTSDRQCTVTLLSDRTATAIFGAGSSQVTIDSLPQTDADGNYVLEWHCSGLLCSTSHQIEEAESLAFLSPTTYFCNSSGGSAGCNWNAGPLFSFTGKANGTYCYRVRDSGVNSGWSEPACVTVARPTQTAVLRLVNQTSYDLVDIRLNGQQQTSYPEVIAVGGSFDFVFTTPGTLRVDVGNGYWVWDFGFVRDIWFSFGADTSVQLGQTRTLTVTNPTLGELLTRFQGSSQDWTGPYYQSGLPYYARMRFSTNASWTLYDSQQACALPQQCNFVAIGSGTAQLTSWPAYSTSVSFKRCPACPVEDFYYPFGVLFLQNGPPSWPTIEYTPD